MLTMQLNRRRFATQDLAGIFQEMMNAPSEEVVIESNRQQTSQQTKMNQPAEGLYVISVAARILSMHPQTLRKYERVGLVQPSRTVGMLRLYSEEDITKLRVIKRLVDELHLNLAGVEMAMSVFDYLSAARHEMNHRASVRAFNRMFNHIMELFEGSSRRQNPQDSEDS